MTKVTEVGKSLVYPTALEATPGLDAQKPDKAQWSQASTPWRAAFDSSQSSSFLFAAFMKILFLLSNMKTRSCFLE